MIDRIPTVDDVARMRRDGYLVVRNFVSPQQLAELLQWTAQKHPQSAGLQDDLADAYLAAGDKEAARAATKRIFWIPTARCGPNSPKSAAIFWPP